LQESSAQKIIVAYCSFVALVQLPYVLVCFDAEINSVCAVNVPLNRVRGGSSRDGTVFKLLQICTESEAQTFCSLTYGTGWYIDYKIIFYVFHGIENANKCLVHVRQSWNCREKAACMAHIA